MSQATKKINGNDHSYQKGTSKEILNLNNQDGPSDTD